MFSLFGIADAPTFKKIDATVLDKVETFISTHILKKVRKWEQSGRVVDYVAYFGEFYEDDPESFKFTDGERMHIQSLVDYVKSVVDKNGENSGVLEFSLNSSGKVKKNVKSNDTETAAKSKEPKPSMQSASATKPGPEMIEKLEQKLFNNILKVLKSKKVDQDVIHQLNIDNVHVNINDNGRISGRFQCILCANSGADKSDFCASCTQKNSGNYWILSNYAEHVGKHNKKRVKNTGKKMRKRNENIQYESVDQKDDTDDEIIAKRSMKSRNFAIILDESNENIIYEDSIDDWSSDDCANNSKIEVFCIDDSNVSIGLSIEPSSDQMSVATRCIYDQLSAQITRMNDTILNNNEDEHDMQFNINNTTKTLQIVEIPGDGDCLFRALAHQISGDAVDLVSLAQIAYQLRTDVVAHVKTNFKSFKMDLKSTVYSKHEGEVILDIQQACKDFVRHDLPKSTEWGGSESLKAVSQLKSVNILIINENGDCYTLPTGFDCSCERTVILAYRQFRLDKTERQVNDGSNAWLNLNHYDSVVRIDQTDIFEISTMLAKKK